MDANRGEPGVVQQRVINALPPLLVQGALSMAGAVLIEHSDEVGVGKEAFDELKLEVQRHS